MINQKRLLIGIAVAVTLGLLIRLLFDAAWAASFFTVMAIGFLVGVPLLIGFVTVYIAEKEKTYKITFAILTPWISIMALFLLTILLDIEGWACWLMALPLFLLFSSLGGVWAHKLRIRKNKERNNLQLSLVLLLPFIITPLERMIGQSTQTYKAYTEIEIHASKQQIWSNVTRVRAIKQQQDSAYFTRFLGFPRPIQAELDTEAIGGRRKAIFDKGLIFYEQVIAYQPYKLMVFTIHANPYEIPSTTMDKHIIVGGDFFDVLNGTYQLEAQGNGSYKLHLYSNYKLHTTVNFYADIWARWIMKDIQQNILKVIKQRSESKT